MSIYNLRPYIGNIPLIGGYNLGPYIGGEVPLPIQLGATAWYNFSDASKIIEGATSVNIAGWINTVNAGVDDLSQLTPANQPTHNIDKAEFDGDDSLSGLQNQTGDFTYIVRLKTSHNASAQVIFGNPLNTTQVFFIETNGALVYRSSLGVKRSYAGPINDGSFQYIALTRTADQIKIYVDDINVLSVTDSGDFLVDLMATFQSSGSEFTGDINYSLIFPSALTLQNIEDLGIYLDNGAPVLPLPEQLGVNMWHNYTDASKIIEGSTAVNIAGWIDETGTYDLSQGTGANQPTYNVNKADFDGDDFLTTGSPTIGNTGLFAGPGEAWTVVVVAEFDGGGYAISNAAANAPDRQFGIFHDSSQNVIGFISQGNDLPRISYVSGTKIFIAVTWDGTNGLVYFGGDSPVALTVGAAIEDTVTSIMIGARTGGFQLVGTMYQDLIFDTTKTPTEIANLKTYLEAL